MYRLYTKMNVLNLFYQSSGNRVYDRWTQSHLPFEYHSYGSNQQGGFCPKGILSILWRGFCPPCKNHEGDYVHPVKSFKGDYVHLVKKHERDFVHLCKNEQRGFCPEGILSGKGCHVSINNLLKRHLLLNWLMSFEIILQECSLSDRLPKLLKWFRLAEQNGHQS